MLIRQAELYGAWRDVRITNGRIATIAPCLLAHSGETVLEGGGGALLPGLHDHHIHLDATGAAMTSLRCGPPEVLDRDALARVLAEFPGRDWLRGVAYHESIGAIDRAWLDRHGPDRPVRIQHRSGRLWIFNSHAMALLELTEPKDGHLLDGDAELRRRLPAMAPDLGVVGVALARHGISGLTDATQRNDAADYRRYADAPLPQRLYIMGGQGLDALTPAGRASVGPVKFHFHDHALPLLGDLVAAIARARQAGRAVAAHCVTRAELALFLLALDETGAGAGDRIEHGSIVSPEFAEWAARQGLTVVSQPHFLAERGDRYRVEVDPADRPWLYPLASLRRAGIALAAGSDAPFGGINPWAAMAAAVDRPPGFGDAEALDPETALALFTGEPECPGGPARRIEVGEVADLCLLRQSWPVAREKLSAVEVAATIIDGAVAYGEIASISPQSSAMAAEIRRIESAI